MCKIWGCPVDDPIFDNINTAQWAWYAHMVAKDNKDHTDLMIDLIEYLASYWNAEAVQRVKESRGNERIGGVKSDDEFEKEILSEAFKNDDIVKAIRDKYKNTNLDSNNMRGRERGRRLPKDFSAIRSLFEDDEQ